MIRRWIRALARTDSSVRPSPVLPTPGRRGRTLLRLEAVEDRTLASVTAGELPNPSAADVAATSAPDSPVPTDDQQAPITDGMVVPSDGWNTGPITSAVKHHGGDGFFGLKSEGGNVFAFDEPATVTARQGTGFDEKVTSDSVPLNRKDASDRTSPSADVGTASPAKSDGPKSAASPASPPSNGQPATPIARAESDAQATSTAVVAQAVPVAARVAKNGSARVVADESVQTGARINRDGRGPRTSAVAVARTTPSAELSDGALLHRFVAHREQTAFTALVQRHGPLVLGVCQRVLGDYHAAQDASQATFVVLARKAGMLDRTSPLGGWLYKVAYHLALRTRAVVAKQRLGDREAAFEETGSPAPADNSIDVEQQELHAVLREELQGLPEKYRTPLALVYIDGRSHADAAQAIGLPRGSMAKRVGEGLVRLRERLEVRGLGL